METRKRKEKRKGIKIERKKKCRLRNKYRKVNDFKNDNGAFYILLTKNEYNIHKDILKDSIYLGDDGYYILLEFN